MHIVITQAVNPDGKRTPTCVAPDAPDQAFHDFQPVAGVEGLLVCTRCAAQAEIVPGDPPPRVTPPGPTPRAGWSFAPGGVPPAADADAPTSAPTRLALRDDPDA